MDSPTELNIVVQLTRNLKNLTQLMNQPDFAKLISDLHTRGKLNYMPMHSGLVIELNKQDIIDAIKFGELLLSSHGRFIE